MKCNHCGGEIKDNCDWRQGRCPHSRSFVDQIKQSLYYTRFYNLLKVIKGIFTRG
jgi:hypothetical protein